MLRKLRDSRDIFSKIWYYGKVLMVEDVASAANKRRCIWRGAKDLTFTLKFT